MKNQSHKQNKSFFDRSDMDNPKHVSRKIKTQQERKVHSQLDKALRRKDLSAFYVAEEYED